MTAIPFMIAFPNGSAFFGWLDGGAAAPRQGGFTGIDWMFAISISAIVGPALAIVMVRLIYWHQRRSDAARMAYKERRTDAELRNFSVSRSIEPVTNNHLATIVVVSMSGDLRSGLPERVYLAAVGSEGAPVPYLRKDSE